MSQKTRIIGGFIAIVVVAGALIGVSVANDQSKKAETNNQSNQSVQQKKEEPQKVSYDGVEGKTALELLKSSYKVETKSYEGLGELVTSIDGVKPSDTQFWAFYVDGKMAEVGAGQYVTKNGEKIEWKLEAISPQSQ